MGESRKNNHCLPARFFNQKLDYPSLTKKYDALQK